MHRGPLVALAEGSGVLLRPFGSPAVFFLEEDP